MYIRYPLSLRQVEDILFERGIDISHETIRYWWNRFGPMFAAEIRKRRVNGHNWSNWRWHLDEVFVRINGERHYLWRAVDHEGEVLEAFSTRRRDRRAALKFLNRTMKRYGRPWSVVTDRLPSYRAAMKGLGNAGRQACGRWLNNRAENSHLPFRKREGAMARFRDIKTLVGRKNSIRRQTPASGTTRADSSAGHASGRVSLAPGCRESLPKIPADRIFAPYTHFERVHRPDIAERTMRGAVFPPAAAAQRRRRRARTIPVHETGFGGAVETDPGPHVQLARGHDPARHRRPGHYQGRP